MRIQLAKKTIDIVTIFKHKPKDFDLFYTQNAVTDMLIQVTYRDIENERLRNSLNDPYGITKESSLELFALPYVICDAMLTYDTFLMHGAVIAVNNEAYMFTAKSGTGKTTHIRQWLKRIPEAFVVNGDKPLIIAGKETPQACGTPWCGKERMGTNAIVPLKAIVFMDRAEENAIRPITFMQAFPRLLAQTHRPEDPELMSKTV